MRSSKAIFFAVMIAQMYTALIASKLTNSAQDAKNIQKSFKIELVFYIKKNCDEALITINIL